MVSKSLGTDDKFSRASVMFGWVVYDDRDVREEGTEKGGMVSSCQTLRVTRMSSQASVASESGCKQITLG